jgi:hypothetical protein
VTAGSPGCASGGALRARTGVCHIRIIVILAGQRKAYGEYRAAFRVIARVDVTAMQARVLPGDRQAQAASIGARPRRVVPVAGVVRNTNALLGRDGIVGLKTGSTQAAGGCLLVAAWQQVNGHNILIVAATFGQPGPAGTILANALQAGHNLVLALDTALDHDAQAGSGTRLG